METDLGRLSGKVALITGASRGIGKAIALRLAKDGANIVVNYVNNADAAHAVRDEIRAWGGKAEIVQADITQTDTIPQLFASSLSHFKRLDILVNNAGVAFLGPFTKLSEADYDRAFAMTKAVYFMLREASRHLENDGRIISLSTGLTRGWAPNAAAYAGSKAAIEQFSRSLSKEVGSRGITVNVVLPGVTETDMTANFPQQVKEHALQQTSLGRLGQPQDIADIVAFLAGQDARWITGQLIVANGGSTP